MATKREIEQLHRAVDDIVLAQGNDFIKELLRQKGLRIGATKTDFNTSLHAAIDSGDITRADLHAWLSEIEGWGAHHAYVFHLDHQNLARELPRSPQEFEQMLDSIQLGRVVKKPKPFDFPGRLRPTEAGLTGTGYRIVWHQGTQTWTRSPDRDYETEIEGDRYRFDAQRLRADRSVVRLAIRSDLELAGIFVPTPLGSEHDTAYAVVEGTAKELLGPQALNAINIGQAQLRLDEQQIDSTASFKTSRSRLGGQGAYVEFGSTTKDSGYAEVDAVRNVRLAARDRLSGESADLTFDVAGPTGLVKPIRVDLNARQGRIYIRAQLAEEQEWEILRQIAS